MRVILEIGPTFQPIDEIDVLAQVIYYLDGSSQEYDVLISWYTYEELLPYLQQWYFVHDLTTRHNIIFANQQESENGGSCCCLLYPRSLV